MQIRQLILLRSCLHLSVEDLVVTSGAVEEELLCCNALNLSFGSRVLLLAPTDALLVLLCMHPLVITSGTVLTGGRPLVEASWMLDSCRCCLLLAELSVFELVCLLPPLKVDIKH